MSIPPGGVPRGYRMARRTIVVVGVFVVAVAVLAAVQAGVPGGVFEVLRDLARTVQSMADGLTG